MEFKTLFHREKLVAAHRGYRAAAPENTMPAFEKSVGRCDFIELDVQLSRDGAVVVLHDDTPERTSDIGKMASFESRRPWRTDSLSLEELRALDFGSWFTETDPFGQIRAGNPAVDADYRGTVIPTLGEVLAFASARDVLLNVEIKEMQGTFDDATVVRTVLDAIVTHDGARRVLVSSFYHPYLSLLKRLAPQIPTAALQETCHPTGLTAYLKELGADAYHMDDAIATETVVRQLREEGYFTGVYTVNDACRREALYGWGVNAVFSDFV